MPHGAIVDVYAGKVEVASVRSAFRAGHCASDQTVVSACKRAYGKRSAKRREAALAGVFGVAAVEKWIRCQVGI